MSAAAAGASADPFAASHDIFEALVGWLEHGDAAGLSAAELEERLQVQSRDVFRQLFADYLELRARDEPRLSRVVDAEGIPHGAVEAGHTRPLATVFGEVAVRRIAYRKRGCPNLYPADAGLNLPPEKQSHGLRKLAAVESSRGSFDEAVQALERATGQKVGKRQVEDLAARAAVDFEDFYATRQPPTGKADDLLVLQVDGKGIVMRPDALRPATAKAAAKARHKLSTRLSKGEKRNRKRMAELGAVYDATPVPRTASDIFPANDTERQAAQEGAHRHQQVAGRQHRAGRRHRHRAGLRRSRPPRPRPHPDLGSAGRRQRPPDRPYPGRGESPRRQHRCRL